MPYRPARGSWRPHVDHAPSGNAGRVVPYATLLRQDWAGRCKADAKTVHAYVRRLRRRLGDDAKRLLYIETEVRVSYRMPRPGDR